MYSYPAVRVKTWLSIAAANCVFSSSSYTIANKKSHCRPSVASTPLLSDRVPLSPARPLHRGIFASYATLASRRVGAVQLSAPAPPCVRQISLQSFQFATPSWSTFRFGATCSKALVLSTLLGA